MKLFERFRKKKHTTKAYRYCLGDLDNHHPITDDLLMAFIDTIKFTGDYQRNAAVLLTPALLEYFAEGWELDRRLGDTRHKTDKGYKGFCYFYQKEFHPLITSQFEVAELASIEPAPTGRSSYNYLWHTAGD